MTSASIPNHWPQDLIEAAMAMNRNRLDIAERLLKARLRTNSDDPRALRMLAEVAGRIGRLHDSEALLRHALAVAPGFQAARANLALVLGRLGRPQEALPLLDELLDHEPETPNHLNLKAATLGRLGDFETAIDTYRKVLEEIPGQPKVWLSLGHMLKTVGRLDEGIAAYREAIALRPTLGEAWWSLANLKTVRFDDDDLAAMGAALEAADITPEDRFHLEFALGKAHHDLGQHDRAFGYYAAANARRREHQPYRAADTSTIVDASIETFTADFFAARTGAGCAAADPIFILGMPRSGSTLLEQILASHSQVEGTTELPDLPALARRKRGYPRSVADWSADELAALGQEYLERTAVQRRTAKPRFIDKLPNNWLFTPFIHLILPNATIVDARRHPLGCCLSNFRQHFARGQAFTYDLADMGHYYADYVRLMGHVDRVLPGRVIRVVYEEMVADPEANIRRLLDRAGLPFEPACLDFHKTERAVRTPSSEQVRRPIYRDAAEEWRAYDAHLQPLRDALGAVIDHYPDAPPPQQPGKTVERS
ncbi:tetratricopeptide repeat-containing sulfotransferase family protein [Sphingomonas astaxanthinifaciens]|nr:sulfotransferase [Sphingomonas astaxanthinifaciens]